MTQDPIEAEQRDLSYHGKNHGETGRDKVYHRFYGPLHTDVDWTPGAALVEGDILDVNASAKLTRVARSVPGAANLLNVWSFITGTTRGAYRALFDATAPTAVSPISVAAAGTGVTAARITHVHGATDIASAATLTTLTTTVNAFIALFYSNVVATNQQLTSNSTAFQNVANMILPLTANQVWSFRMTIRYTSSVAADFKFQFTVPAGATLEFSSGAVLFGGVNTFLGSFGPTTPAPADGIAAPLAIEVMGTITNGANVGNLQLQAAQNTATVEATDFVLTGSNVTGRRVA